MPDFAPPYPKTILCTTDLSSRCDRALDRAAMLACDWQARLVVVHALETASDFLQSRRRHGLELAAHLFAQAPLTLFHAYKVLTGGGLDTGQTRDGWRDLVRRDAQTFLDGSDLGPRERNERRLLLEEGAPSRGALMEMLLGSTAQRLVDGMPCDVLVARPPTAELP